jgi:AcrR family transcriptional regulator
MTQHAAPPGANDSAQSRRDREKQARAEAILDAAEHVFFSKGFAQTSMDEIARQAEVSRALVYVYYKDKAALMRAIMLRAIDTLATRFERAIESADSGLAQIDRIGQAYYAFSVEEADYFNVMTDLNTFPEPVEPDQQMDALTRCRARIKAAMVRALENGLRDGSIAPERVANPLQTAFFLQGALHGVIMQTRGPFARRDGYPEGDVLIRYAISMLTHSMRNG